MNYKQGAYLCALLQVLLWQPVLLQWSFSVPRDITALEGSCVVIPCTFTSSVLRWNRRLIFTWSLWRTSGYPEVYNNKDPTNVLPQYKGRALLAGDLLDHNCTLQISNVTGGDADTYYPLIDQDYSHRVSVKVSGTPAQPTVTYPQTMSEGDPAKITCTVEHTCPTHLPTMAWDKIHSNVSVYHEKLLNGIWRTVLVLNYTPIAEHHKEEFVCSATFPSGKSASRSITLSIRYAPKNTTAAEFFNRKTIKEGDTVTLSCSSRGNPEAKTYHWFEGPEKNTALDDWSRLTLNNISWDSGPYICTATNDVGTGESPPLHLNIQHAAKGVHAVLSEDPEEGKPMELSCATKSSNPRATLFTWYKNEKVIQEGKTLKIERTAVDVAGVYRCVAHNAVGSTSSATVTVDVKPSISYSIVALVTGVLVAVLAAAIGAILLTRRYLNNKKKKNVNTSNQLTQLSRHDEGQNPSQNVDNVYAALDGTQAASEYEDIRRNYIREETTHTIDCHC